MQLLRLCAFLAPEAIQPSLLAADPAALPAELTTAVGDELRLDAAVAALYRFSLLSRDHDGLRLHRLVSEVVRATLPLDDQQWWAAAAVAVVAAGFPADIKDPASWPVCARLLPHALATTEHAEALEVAAQATSHLLSQIGVYLDDRAEFAAAQAAYQRALRIAEAAYGPNHPEVAIRVNNLGSVLEQLGDLAGARANYERALRVFEAVYGPDHPNTRTVAANLAGLQDHQ